MWLLLAPSAGPQSPSRAGSPSVVPAQHTQTTNHGPDMSRIMRHSREKTTPCMAPGPREGLFKYQVLQGCHSHVVPLPSSSIP